jgi:quercetin dioxygenase-like cupin family protein
MSHVKFDRDEGNLVSGSYSTGVGPVLRSETMEITKISYERGKGADEHSHPEEQVMYVLSGLLRVTCDGETYDVAPGEATYNPSNAPHSVVAVEPVVALSFKNQVAPVYEATGQLG